MPVEPTSPQPCRVLVLPDAGGLAQEWLPLLGERGSVRLVTTVEEALAALREERFDLILSGGSQWLPLACAAGREQGENILEAMAQGVCIVASDGNLVWANATLRAYPPEVVEAIRQACAGLLEELAADTGPASTPRVQRRALRVGSGYSLDVTVSASAGTDGRIDQVIGLVCNASAISRLREKLDAIDAAGRELVALDGEASSLLDVEERLRLLEGNLIRYCRDLLDFTNFAVFVLDPQTNRLEPVLTGGLPEQIKALTIHATKEGNGISGYVAATGQSYVCPDVTEDPLYLPGLEAARSSLTVPLRLNDRVVGVLNVESDQRAAFSEEDRQIAEIFARYVAVALNVLKLLAAERSETAGQVTADVTAELARPLDNIVFEAGRLMEEIGDREDAQRHLRAIIDDVDRVKQALQSISELPAIRGLMPEPAADPILKGKRVLVADDEDIIRDTISDVLSRVGALATTARDGAEAVTMINSQHFDLVLSDIKMPHKNGYEVFAAAKKVRKGCPVILITGFGYDPEHSIVRASGEGLAAVLFKPFKVEQLLENIQKAIALEAG